MSCWLCGNEEEGRHHLGCARIGNPGLSYGEAVKRGLVAPPEEESEPEPDRVEVLKEGSMSTIPEPEEPEVGMCEYNGCDNPKASASPRAKYCEEHKDPKNRKE